jgi:hypothetical protein
MPKFGVTIVKTYVTVVEVDAVSAAAARKQVTEYGLVEAVSDFPVINEDLMVERIKKVEKI